VIVFPTSIFRSASTAQPAITGWIGSGTNRFQVNEVVDIEGALFHIGSVVGGLYDDFTDAISFIDFGSAMITDPVLDVASLSLLGPELNAQLAGEYPILAACADDAAVVAATFHLQDALYGARQGDWSYVRDLLLGYVAP
jgi:hypothetical protein